MLCFGNKQNLTYNSSDESDFHQIEKLIESDNV